MKNNFGRTYKEGFSSLHLPLVAQKFYNKNLDLVRTYAYVLHVCKCLRRMKLGTWVFSQEF